jgi:peptide deformylase
MADIRIYGDPVLRKKAVPVTVFDEELRAFIEQMKDDMYVSDGVGLAAPQVGRSIRLTVIDATAGEQEPYVLINPEIYFFSEEKSDYDEGCLSVPDITLTICRPTIVSVRALDENGTSYTLENVDGLFARAIQHETDHLDGILFVDRATPVRRQLISGKLKKLAKSQRQNSKPA